MARRDGQRGWIRSHGPMAVFSLLTIVGCCFIWASKSLHWGIQYATIVPIALMLAYFILAFVADGLRLHDEQTGDNLYYMGFLFTLTSLGASLYQFTSQSSIDDIVRNFGIAITSTITGIALRIFYNQMRRDPLDVERATRHELASAARRVRAEMDAATQEFTVYRRTSNQMLQEGFEEIGRQAEETGKQIRSTLDQLGLQALTPLQLASDELKKVIDSNSKAFDQLMKNELGHAKASSEALNNTNKAVVESMTDLNKQISSAGKRLRNIKPPEEVIKIEIEPILEKVASIAISHVEELTRLSEQQRNEFASVLAELSAHNRILPQVERLVGLVERSVLALERASRPGSSSTHGQPPAYSQPAGPEEAWPDDGRQDEPPRQGTPDPPRSNWRPWQR